MRKKKFTRSNKITNKIICIDEPADSLHPLHLWKKKENYRHSLQSARSDFSSRKNVYFFDVVLVAFVQWFYLSSEINKIPKRPISSISVSHAPLENQIRTKREKRKIQDIYASRQFSIFFFLNNFARSLRSFVRSKCRLSISTEFHWSSACPEISIKYFSFWCKT